MQGVHTEMFKRFVSGLTALLIATTLVAAPIAPDTVVAQGRQTAPLAKKSQITDRQRASKNIVQIKFTESSEVSLVSGVFAGKDTTQIAELNTVLAQAQKVRSDNLGNKHANKDADPVRHALRNHYQVRFARDVDTIAITERLNTLSIVEHAYAAPKPVRMPATPDFSALQTYLKAAPDGINRGYAKTFPGGTGDRVKIVDIEYGWNVNHEDLSKARAAFVPNGTPYNPFDDNHGTAVLGQLIADENGYGVTGAAPGATIELINAANHERGWDVAGALALAGTRTKPGDVILLEQQSDGPGEGDDYLPVEWMPAVYDAVVALTSSGRIVIEAAGNGYQDLNNPALGTSFPAGKPDSGAIIVGAGEHCDAFSKRSRLHFSNYGSRLDVHGPGNCVTTIGYGWLHTGAGKNSWYTNGFSGTSSASPVVAAAAASFSSAYQTLNNRPPSPLELRMLMIYTGTPQNVTSGMLPGKIGPQPNLAKLLPTADKAAPGIPRTFTLALSSNKPNLKWAAPADNVKATKYEIYRDGKLYKTVTTASFRDAAAVKGKRYYYKVRAMDDAGNRSAFTTQLSIVSK